MNKRDSVRYGAEGFSEDMSQAAVSWGGADSITANVVNYSAHGIRISIPAALCTTDLPKKKDVIRVHLPIDRLWFTGMCVFAANEPDGSVTAGIYFYKPEEQNYLKNLLFNALDAPCTSDSFISYEWEERVARLCNSEDPTLRKIGEEKLRSLHRLRKHDSSQISQ